jgi:hypothetical protein
VLARLFYWKKNCNNRRSSIIVLAPFVDLRSSHRHVAYLFRSSQEEKRRKKEPRPLCNFKDSAATMNLCRREFSSRDTLVPLIKISRHAELYYAKDLVHESLQEATNSQRGEPNTLNFFARSLASFFSGLAFCNILSSTSAAFFVLLQLKKCFSFRNLRSFGRRMKKFSRNLN